VELLDRYLKTVALWLPRAQASDIVAELRADIQAEIEDRRAEAGRDLTRDEYESILTRWGHPMLVASRYQTHEPFIGPALLPTYYFVLKMVAAFYLLPWLLLWFLVTQIVPGWGDAGAAGLVSLRPLVIQALVLFALITAGFAVVDRRQRRERTLETWTARELTTPRTKRDWREKSRASAAFDLVVDLAVFSWWVGLAGVPAALLVDPAVRVVIPFAHALVYWSVLGLLAASIIMAVADLLYPRWTIRRLGLQIGMDITGVLVGLVLMSYSVLEAVPGADTDLARSGALVHWVNLSWKITIGIIAAILIGRIGLNVRRLGKVNTAGPAAAILAALVICAAMAR